MNKNLKKLLEQATIYAFDSRFVHGDNPRPVADVIQEKFAELIVEECRTVIVELYRKTSLELCGPLLTADEEIVKHFYGVEE